MERSRSATRSSSSRTTCSKRLGVERLHCVLHCEVIPRLISRTELVEYGQTQRIFTNPSDKRTEDYVTGRFG